MIKKLSLEALLITRGQEGMTLFKKEKGKVNRSDFPTETRDVFDVSGAGDTVIASLASALSSGMTLEDSVKLANAAAGIVVSKSGTASPSLAELSISLNSDDLVLSKTEIKDLVKEAKKDSKKIVFTNGCFDLLHEGHVRYLETAKGFGDVLILGLNSDRSVHSLKGDGRPINMQVDRAYILAALEVVDYVVIFDEDSPYDLIKSIKPHTLVKGGDYQGEKVVGQDIADKLKLVQFVDGKSTTKTIEKIKQAN